MNSTPNPEPHDVLRGNLAAIRTEIAAGLATAGRPAGAARLVVVTKTESVDVFGALAAAGVSDVGENRVLPALERRRAVDGLVLRWHMIGHLQRNKVGRALEWADVFHAVDSPRLIDAIDSSAAKAGRRAPIFLQVNVSGEDAKGGFAPDACAEALERACSRENLEFRGWMTMAPFGEDPESSRPVFRALRQMRDDLHARGIGLESLPDLSMGMSGDYRVAVEEGSTHVRVGSAVFDGVHWPERREGTGSCQS